MVNLEVAKCPAEKKATKSTDPVVYKTDYVRQKYSKTLDI